MADSRARAGLVQYEPGTSCCTRKERSAQKNERTPHKDTEASLKGYPVVKSRTLNIKIIKYSKELRPTAKNKNLSFQYWIRQESSLDAKSKREILIRNRILHRNEVSPVILLISSLREEEKQILNYTIEKLGNTLGNESYHHQREPEGHHRPQDVISQEDTTWLCSLMT